MKSIRTILLSAVALAASLHCVHAQSTDSFAQTTADDLAVMLQLIEQTPPTPAASLPDSGTFWSAQHAPGTDSPWPPLPANLWELSAWPLGDENYLLNDTNLDYDALSAVVAASQPATPSPMTQMSMMSSSYAYGNPVYLTNMSASVAYDGSVTVNFSIGGGTNFVPYDILMSTNVAAPVASWNWLGIGYTSNNYTFYEQPTDLGFYILAKPSKTMVVPWGDDTYAQSEVPMGITNALMVAGGWDHSLALLSDGTVVAWGQNDYGEGSVPTNIAGVTMIAAGWYHNVALLTNGLVTAWGLNAANLGWYLTNVPPDLTNATVISAQALHSLALRNDGTVVAWGYNQFGETNVPSSLSNVVAIAAGYQHNLAVKSDGTVVAWGYNGSGQCNVPAGLSNVVDVAAGIAHSLALRNDGTVVAWGRNSFGETNVPANLSNVVAIAAGGDLYAYSSYTLALKSDGTVVAWGAGEVVTPLGGMSNVIAIAGGVYHALAIRSGPRTPVITLQPTDQYKIAGGNATFTAKGLGLYGVTYQWQTNGVNLSGETNATLTLTNVQAAQTGVYNVVVSNEVGSILSTNATLYLVTPPVITSMTLPTNQVCIYGNILSFSVTATSLGQLNGFPLSYQWKLNGTNIGGATTAAYNFTANDDSSGIYSVTVANAAGNTNVAWQVTVTNAINVTNDLLLIYNTNSVDSSNVCAYYLARRPLVSGANVLGIGCTNTESFLPDEYTNVFVAQIGNWLTNNPTKRPQYVILFLDIPSRINTNRPPPNESVIDPGKRPSVSYSLSAQFANWQPFVTHINMGTTNDCQAYIDKLKYFGDTYSPGKLVISANSFGSYGNTNYVLDGIRFGGGYTNGVPDTSRQNYSGAVSVVAGATNGLLNAGVSTNAILFFDGVEIYTNNIPPPFAHPGAESNIAGYMCWGAHSLLGGTYPTDGKVTWLGDSRWWIMETVESFNGQRVTSGDNFTKWFSSNAFGGSNYSNTPIGAVSHVDEPGLGGVNTAAQFFGLWASGKNFGIAAWKSENTFYFQAVGDPLVAK